MKNNLINILSKSKMENKEEILDLIFDAIYSVVVVQNLNRYSEIIPTFIKNDHDMIVPWLEARSKNGMINLSNTAISNVLSKTNDTNMRKFFKFCVEKYRRSCKNIYFCVEQNCDIDVVDKVKMLIFEEYGLEEIREILNENELSDFIEKVKDSLDEKQYNIYKIKYNTTTEDEIVNIIKTMQLDTNECQTLLQFFSKKEPISKKIIDAINDQLQGIVLVEK